MLLAGVTVVWGTSMVLLFSDVFFVRRSFPEKFRAVQRTPWGVLALCGVVGVLADAAAVVLLFWAPWAPIFTRSGWALAVGTITVASIGANHRLVNKPTIRGREPMRVKRLDPGRAPDAAASLLETRSGRPDQSARRARRAASADWIGAHNVS